MKSSSTQSLLRIALNALLAASVFTLISACHRHDEHHDHENSTEHKHTHTAPHGGAAVVLGDELFHIEFVRDSASGLLQAYIMDGELEKFIRISIPSFEVSATIEGQPRKLVFKPVPNPATGEAIGDTSLYEARADWLKTPAAENFDAIVEDITVKGTQFKTVKFNFPKGNEDDQHDHDHSH